MTGRGRRGAGLLTVAVACCLLVAAPASATFHLMRIREAYPGSVESPQAEYVELQMLEGGQQFVGGHVLRTYGVDGTLLHSNSLASDVANGASQSTILLATPEAEAQFGVGADEELSPSGQLDPAGGAVCWETLDCVSWGAFGGSTPSPAGPPADPFGIPDGRALRRSIAAGCPSLLEQGDDSDASANDFADAFPAPRPNAVVPAEHACSATGAVGATTGAEGGASGDDGRPPQTRIHRSGRRQIHDRTPTFRFSSSVPGSTYLCRLDRRRFRICRSPFTARRLRLGAHVFEVEARGPEGSLDPSPASYRFEVVR